jgi:hypothetical protein
MSHAGGGGGGAAFSRGGGGGSGGAPGGFSVSHAAPSGSTGGNFGAATVGGNSNMTGTMAGRGDARMGRMDHDRGHDGRFRGPNFAFGVYPGYDYNSYDYDYDPGCYQPRQVHTRYGWRWRQVWVCN